VNMTITYSNSGRYMG